MNFDLAEDQILLRDSVARLMAAEYGFEARRAYMREPRGWSEAMWSRYAELGLQGLLIPADHGGYGGGGVELMQVMQEFGGALAMEPFLHGTVLPAMAIAAAGSEAQQATLLPRIADGSLRAAFAHADPGSRGGAADIATTAHFDGAGWLLRGSKDIAVQGGDAALLVVTARSAGKFGEREDIRLFAITPDRPGLRRRDFRMQDGRAAAEIALDGVRAEGGELLHRPGIDGFAAVERVLQTAIAGIVAESLGSMDALFAMTVEYLKTRVQFGRPIGSNQSLQHRAAEMLVALEQARGMAMLAAASLGEADADARRRNLAMAKAHVGELGRSLSKAAVQLHGGIAMTEEYAVGHHFRRLMVNEQLFGAPRHHLASLADTLSFAGPVKSAKPLTQSADMILSA